MIQKAYHQRRMAAVEIVDDCARLELTYKVYSPVEESDCNSFVERIGGRWDLTEAQARHAVVEAAAAWVRQIRAEGNDIGAWDAQGNTY